MLHYNTTIWCWTIVWLIWLQQPNKLWGKIHMQKPLIQYNYHLTNGYQNEYYEDEEQHQHQHQHHQHHHHQHRHHQHQHQHHYHHQQHNRPNYHYSDYPHYYHQQHHQHKYSSNKQLEQRQQHEKYVQQQQEQHLYQLSDYDLVEMATTTTTDINEIVSPRLVGFDSEEDAEMKAIPLHHESNNNNKQKFAMHVASANHHHKSAQHQHHHQNQHQHKYKHHDKSQKQQQQQQQYRQHHHNHHQHRYHEDNVVTTTSATAPYPHSFTTTIPLSLRNSSISNMARIVSTAQEENEDETETQINPRNHLDSKEDIINLYALKDNKIQLTPRLKSSIPAVTTTATINSVQSPDDVIKKHVSNNSLMYQQQHEEEKPNKAKHTVGEAREYEKQIEDEQVKYSDNNNTNNNNTRNNSSYENSNKYSPKSFLARHTKFNLNTLNGHYRHQYQNQLQLQLQHQHHQHQHQQHRNHQRHYQPHELAKDQTEYGGEQLEQSENQNQNYDEDELDDTDSDDYYEEDEEYTFRHNNDENDNDTKIHGSNDTDDHNVAVADASDDEEDALVHIDKDKSSRGSSSSSSSSNSNSNNNNNNKSNNKINNNNNNNNSPSVDSILNDDNLSDRSYTRITRSRLDYDYVDDEPQYHNTIVDDFRNHEHEREHHNNNDGDPSPPGVITEQKYSEVGNEKAVQQARERYVQQENNKRPRTPHELATDHWHRMIVATKCRKPLPRVIPVSNNTSKRYEPYATILYRCGEDTGCCGSTASICTVKRYDIVMVYVFSYDFNYRKEIEALPMQNHTECHCVNRGSLAVHDSSSSRGKRSGQHYKYQQQEQQHYQYQHQYQQGQQPQHQSEQQKLWAQSFDKRWRRSDVIANSLYQSHHQHEQQSQQQQLRQRCNDTNFSCLCPRHFSHLDLDMERQSHLPQSPVTNIHKCLCDCLPNDYICERYKRGEELFDREDRKCINYNCCKPPICLYGVYNNKLGKCPTIHRTTIDNYPKKLPYQSHHHNHSKQQQTQSTSQDRSHLIKLDLN